MTVHALQFEEIEDEPQAYAPPPPRPVFQFPTQQVLGALAGIAAILGARAILLTALVCAFALASAAQHAPSQVANTSLGLFLLFGFLPTVYLAGVRKI